MTWFRVDDGFWSHPKTLGLSDAAIALWVRAGAYASQHLTDGLIPAAALRMLGERTAADELVNSELWDIAPGGYVFHDWDEYQETSSTVKDRRAAARERQRKSRAARNGKPPATEDDSDDVTPPVTRDEPCDIPSDSRREFATPDPTRPDLREVTEVTSQEAPRKRAPAADRGTRLPENWKPADSTLTAMRNEFPDIDLRQEHAKFADHWASQPGAKGRKSDWDATWRNWIRRSAESFRPRPVSVPGAVSRGDQKVMDTFSRGEELKRRLAANQAIIPSQREIAL